MIPSRDALRAAALLLLGGAAGLALACPPAYAQNDGELLSVQRDQNRIGLRLASLREKMDRLVDRYEAEGRTRNAELLRAAIEQFDGINLLEQSREIDRGLQSAMLSTVGQQDTLVTALESIYSVLRDRRDVDELREQAELLSEGIDELDRLAVEQHRLLQETLAGSDTPAAVMDEALAEAQRLQRSLDDNSRAQQTLETTAAALGEVAMAEFLAERQRALAEDPGTSAADEQLLSEGVAKLLSGLEQPLVGARDSELLSAAQSQRGRAREAVAAALTAMEQASAELAAKEAMAEGSGAEPGGESAAGSVGGAESGAGEEAGSESSGAPGTGEEGAPGDAQESTEPTTEATGAEAEPGKRAADAAQESMAEASAQLDQARDALAESERTLAAARNRARAMAAAAGRQAERQAEALKQDAQRLEAVEPEEGPELLDRTRDLMAELAAMQEAQQNQQSSAAAAQGAAAQQSLNDILEQLRRRRQGADESPREAKTPEQLNAAVAQQKELKRRLRELMDRLEELPDQEFQQPGKQADSAMDSAAEALEQGRDQEAASRQEEAEEALEKAKKKLQGERDRYEQLRQEEVLFRLGEELKELLDGQIEVSTETREIHEARGDRERLSRSHRRAVVRLSETERSMSREATSIAEELSADGAKVFVFAIEQIADDLESIADELADQETGTFVASIQRGVEQRLADLSAVLADELERRRKAMAEADPQQPPPDQGQQGKQPLVPPVAELLLIQRMELMALTRIENFQNMHPEAADEGLGEMELMMLERWALEHSKTTTLFGSMIPAAPEVGLEGAMEPGAEPGEEGTNEGGER